MHPLDDKKSSYVPGPVVKLIKFISPPQNNCVINLVGVASAIQRKVGAGRG